MASRQGRAPKAHSEANGATVGDTSYLLLQHLLPPVFGSPPLECGERDWGQWLAGRQGLWQGLGSET